MKPFRAFLGGSLVLATLLVAGCGGDKGEGQEGRLSGAVRVDGSSTVYPITEAVAEEFMRENPDVRVTVGVSGTGGGFSKFVRGEVDINDASRPIKPSEAEQAKAAGIEFIELPVAYDGLAVIANPQNNWVDCLTVEELKKIWEPDSKVTNWSQVRAGFPDRPIRLYGPGTDSGTYDYFTDAVVGKEGASRADFTASEDDNVLVQGIQGDQNALGFFGMAYYETNKDRLKLIGIDDGKADDGVGCVLPSTETVRNGTYQPLARPVFIYVSQKSVQNAAVKSFVDYYLQHAVQLTTDVGYVPLTEQAYQLAQNRVQNGITGSVFSGGSQIGVRLEDLLKAEGGVTPAADTAASADAKAAQ